MGDELEDDVERPLTEAGQKVGGAAGRKLAKAGSKAMKKGAGKAASSAGKAVSKLALLTLKGLGAMLLPFLPYILGFLVIFGLSQFTFDMLVDSRPKNQEFQMEEVAETNTYEDVPDEQGYYPVKSISSGNKLVKAFYTYFSDRSYWYVTDDSDDKTIPKGADDPQVLADGIKDKYDREKAFYLSPTSLFTLDEFLNDGEFRIPEQFIQPVPYEIDEKTGDMTLVDILDEEGNMQLESTTYNKKGLPTDKKTPGVWDYGFAPVFHYEEFEEEMQYKGSVTQIEKWDKGRQEKVWVSASGKEIEAKETKVRSLGKVWMIDQLVSPGGTIRNTIKHEWKDTGQAWIPDPENYKYTEKVEVLIWKRVHYKNEDGKKMYWKVNPDKPSDRYESTEKSAYPIYTMKSEYEKQKKTFLRKVEGTRWEKVPEYEGEPDFSEVTGTKYYRDYMESYRTYVPEDVMTTFNIAKRLDMTEGELQKLLENTEDGASSEAGSIDAEGLNLGEGVSNDNYTRALENLPLFQKYGNLYGVDPYLLLAMAARESSGSHYTENGAVKVGSATGLMQIERLGTRPVTAYNFETGSKESFSVDNETAKDIEFNVKWAAMYTASQMKVYDYNFLVGMQSYNFGSYYRDQNWSLEGAQSYSTDKMRGGGDPKYVPHVLQYYASPETPVPYVITDNSETVTMDDSDLPMGSVQAINANVLNAQSGGSLWTSMGNQMRYGWNEMRNELKDTFGLEDKNVIKYHGVKDKEPRMKVAKHKTPDRAWEITMSLLAFEEQKPLRAYQGFTEEDFKERFKLLFTNPLGGLNQTSGSSAPGINPTSYFKDGYSSPITNPKVITTYGFVAVDGKQVYHAGIDLAVTDGQAIRAVAKGRVIAVETKGTTQIVIEHSMGTVTTYKDVKDIKVNVDDLVEKGDVIAKGGGGKEHKGTFHFELRQHGRNQDPTWVVDSSLLSSGGAVVIDPNAKGIFQHPFPNQTAKKTSSYGYRTHPVYGGRKLHKGTDLVGEKKAGSIIHAIGDGKVITSTINSYWGNHVIIDHGVIPEIDASKNVYSVYGHMQNNSVKVSAGSAIVKGAAIGAMGATGKVRGAHLHIEIHVGTSWASRQSVDAETLIDM